MTLPSNSSMKTHPNNTLTRYVTHLSNRVDLDGEWEVGLSEIMFPRTWYNAREDELWFDIIGMNNSTFYHISIPEGCYVDPFQFFEKINSLIAKAYEEKKETPEVKFNYNQFSRKTIIRINSNIEIQMSTELIGILGFDCVVPPELPCGVLAGNSRHVAKRALDLEQGFFGLYVYCDILESIPVGDTRAPLLRVVDVSGKFGENIHRIYNTPHYIPLQRRDFSEVVIDIRDDSGQPVPFQFGKIVVTLHFRRTKNLFLPK